MFATLFDPEADSPFHPACHGYVWSDMISIWYLPDLTFNIYFEEVIENGLRNFYLYVNGTLIRNKWSTNHEAKEFLSKLYSKLIRYSIA